jgi:hypothetical protein
VTVQIVGYARSSGWVSAVEIDEADPVVYVSAHRLFVVRNGAGFLALSAVSPHRPEIGERVLYCPSGYFVGPHGELFDQRGFWIDGPSPRGMDRFEVRVRYGAIEVNVATSLRGPPRVFAKELLAFRLGRPCDIEHWEEVRPGFLARPAKS